eukprot:2198345-Amphidinium_carterae.2
MSTCSSGCRLIAACTIVPRHDVPQTSSRAMQLVGGHRLAAPWCHPVSLAFLFDLAQRCQTSSNYSCRLIRLYDDHVPHYRVQEIQQLAGMP